MSAELDPVIHPVHRLQICALLANADEMEFALLRERTGCFRLGIVRSN